MTNQGDCLRELLKKVAEGDVYQQDQVSTSFAWKFGIPVLLYASMHGLTEIVKKQLARPGVRVNCQDEDGWTSLTWASNAGHIEIVRLLLTHPDLQVNIQDKCYKDTALMWACYKGHTDIVRLLLQHADIDINLRTCNKYGTTALGLASGEGRIEIVRMLLACPGVDVNAQEKLHQCIQRLKQDGDTALMAAAGRGHTIIVQMLLNCSGIDVRAYDYADKTALDLATNENIKDLIRQHLLAAIPEAPYITVRSATTHTRAPAATWSAARGPTPTIKPTSTTTAPTTTKQPSSWLATRLLRSGYDLAIIRDCEQKLVLQEGFALESDFADCLPTEFNRAYLISIGILGLGTQKRLLALHSELHAQRVQQQTTTALSPPLPAPQEVFGSAAVRAKSTRCVQVDDNFNDPVYVEPPLLQLPVPVPVHESALGPVCVEPGAKRSKASVEEGEGEGGGEGRCKQM